MPQKIYYGDAIIRNTRTAQSRTISGVIYTDKSNPNDEHTRNNVLKSLKPSERPAYQIAKLCFEGAKQIGETIK